jgi:Peptidase A4 family
MKNRRITGRRRVLAAGALSALLAGALNVAASTGAAAVSPPETTSQPGTGLPVLDGPHAKVETASRWAGYVATGGKKPFTYVAATFKVAAVDCGMTPHPSDTSQWVGLDGWHGKTVEQIGVESDCGGDPDLPPNAAHYDAWWEMYPDPPHDLGPVKAGDTIEAQVYRIPGGSPGDGLEYVLDLQDVTRGRGMAAELAPCPTVCKDATAEVISEGFNEGSRKGPADFGRETFSDISLGEYEDLIGNFETKSWTNIEAVQAQENKHHELTEDADPGPLRDGGTKFTVRWISDK